MADNDITYNRIPAKVLKRWKTVRDVCGDGEELRDPKADYLPYLNRDDTSDENIERNRAYRERAVLYGATGFTLAGLIGLAFRHQPKHALPEKLKYLLKNADGAGVSIYQQSQAALANVLGPGRHGLYTDFSSELKRPNIKAYLAEDIINWRHKTVGGKTVLSLVVLREDIQVEDGYATNTESQWRELFLNDKGQCACRLWQLDDAKKPVVVLVQDAEGRMVSELVLRSVKAPLDYIPFEFVGSQNNDASIDESPLYSLAKVNVGHFRNSADYEDAAFMHGQSQFWISGLTEEWRDHLEKQGMYIGARKPMLLPVDGACGFAQAQPNMVAKEAMEHKEAQMVALGARLIDKKSAVKTATQSEGEREASTSILALCVSNVSEAYQRSIRSCARYLDITLPEGEDLFEINQDFTTVSNDPLTISALVGAWQQGLMAKEDVRSYFRRQGTIDPERTDEQIDADLKKSPPPTPAAEKALTPE
jgi:hypothetical protein